jgi:TonB family protein
VKSPTTPPPVKSPTTPPPLADEAVTSPARPAIQPNAAELWARASTPASEPTQPEPESVESEVAPEDLVEDVGDEAADDAPSAISTLFANQPPARKREPTRPPAHIETAGRPLPHAPDMLPEGDFSYPLKRSGAGLLLKIVIALAVMAAGFFAFTQLYPSESKQTASVTPPDDPPAPPVAGGVVETPVAAAPVVDAQTVDEPVGTPATKPPIAETPATKPPIAETPATKPPTTDTSAAKPTTKPTTKPATDTKPKPTTTTAAETSDTKTEPASGECDEVSCIMTKYERACCLRYKPVDGFTPKNVIPDGLDKAMVKAGIETVKPRIVACGEQNGAKGTVRVAVSVNDAGKVTNANVTESPDTALGECVAAALRKAKFGKSVNGADFTYPFVF